MADSLELLAGLTPECPAGASLRNLVGAGWVVNADLRQLDRLNLPNFEVSEHPVAEDRLVVDERNRWTCERVEMNGFTIEGPLLTVPGR